MIRCTMPVIVEGKYDKITLSNLIDGTIIDVSDTVTDAMGTVVEKGSNVADEVKEKSVRIYQKGREKAGEAVSKIKKDSEEIDFSECFDENDNDSEIKDEDEIIDINGQTVEDDAAKDAADDAEETKEEK